MMQPECGRIQWGRVTTQTQVRYALNHLIGQMQIWPTKIDILAKLTRNIGGVFQPYILKAGDRGDRSPPIFFIFRQNLG